MTNITFQSTVVLNSTFPSAEEISSKLGAISSIIGSEILQQEPTSSPDNWKVKLSESSPIVDEKLIRELGIRENELQNTKEGKDVKINVKWELKTANKRKHLLHSNWRPGISIRELFVQNSRNLMVFQFTSSSNSWYRQTCSSFLVKVRYEWKNRTHCQLNTCYYDFRALLLGVRKKIFSYWVPAKKYYASKHTLSSISCLLWPLLY